jgi:hypothetical protein
MFKNKKPQWSPFKDKTNLTNLVLSFEADPWDTVICTKPGIHHIPCRNDCVWFRITTKFAERCRVESATITDFNKIIVTSEIINVSIKPLSLGITHSRYN